MTLPIAQQNAEINEFLEELKKPTPSPAAGRLIFGLDATASREPTWDRACQIQHEMFEATAGLGALEIQLLFYRGFGECKHSRWLGSAIELHQVMSGVHCLGGYTQIERILDHAIYVTQSHEVGALVFVGDAMEESSDPLCHRAGELGRLGVPVFVFHEGNNPTAGTVFKQIAALSHGAYLSFDLACAEKLKTLLGAVAVYATGGYPALAAYSQKNGGDLLRLTSQLRS